MSVKLDRQIETTGTKFKVFPQPRFLSAFSQPETITISVPPHMIEPGPADDRFYVVDAINKRPYRYPYPYLPPYRGPSNPPVQPDPATGHFDHLDVDSREFKCAHMYAIVRRALDIWEDYFGRRIEWHFNSWYQRMELIPLIYWNNAHSGWGFLEFGFPKKEGGGLDTDNPYCMNFDVLVHELGHSIVFSQVGFPRDQSSTTNEYWGFHESAGDVVALISLLHFDKVVSYLLDQSKGNLFTVNELSRLGELSQSQEIRRAFNYELMSTVGSEEHDLSQPLTGALFDIFVEVFQKELVKNGLISQELADLSYHGPEEPVDDSLIQDKFDLAYVGKEIEFKSALFRARDYWGELLAKTWSSLSPNNLYYADIVSSLLSTDANLTGGKHQETIRECCVWREISFPGDSIAFRSFYVSDLHLD